MSKIGITLSRKREQAEDKDKQNDLRHFGSGRRGQTKAVESKEKKAYKKVIMCTE